jgi:hypothetical protein
VEEFVLKAQRLGITDKASNIKNSRINS